MERSANISLWFDQLGEITPRASLSSSIDADVVIVGAGYTGLWTAYYLLEADPALKVAIVEAEVAGFGASGRNGGWCSALFAASAAKIARHYGRDAAISMQRAMDRTVDEVGRVCHTEQIACDFHKGGTLTFATSSAHVDRVQALVREAAEWSDHESYRWLSNEEASQRIRVAGSLGAAFTPDCARIQPAKLARGLAEVVERKGARIFENTLASEIAPGLVRTAGGDVKAPVVVRATEGYTVGLKGLRRALVPLYSLMIATEPLPAVFWDSVGWNDYETVTDGRHLLIYAQRTADDRIAFGGRGAPYHYGSRIEPGFDREPRVFAGLAAALTALFPSLRDVRVTHRWGGPLGVARDWFSSVDFDRNTGLGRAGGFAGDGVSTSNLAGRTLADLILGHDSELTSLPWVGHRSRRWEPEPLRWIGINLALRALASADRSEARTGRPSSKGRAMRKLVGL